MLAWNFTVIIVQNQVTMYWWNRLHDSFFVLVCLVYVFLERSVYMYVCLAFKFLYFHVYWDNYFKIHGFSDTKTGKSYNTVKVRTQNMISKEVTFLIASQETPSKTFSWDTWSCWEKMTPNNMPKPSIPFSDTLTWTLNVKFMETQLAFTSRVKWMLSTTHGVWPGLTW